MSKNFIHVLVKLRKDKDATKILKEKYGFDWPTVNSVDNVADCYNSVFSQFKYTVDLRDESKNLNDMDNSCEENCKGLFLINKRKAHFMYDSDRFWFVLNWINN